MLERMRVGCAPEPGQEQSVMMSVLSLAKGTVTARQRVYYEEGRVKRGLSLR